MPKRYDWRVLKLAWEYQRGSGRYPFNPNRLEIQSLWEIDLDFIHDFELYCQHVEFWKQRLKRKGGG